MGLQEGKTRLTLLVDNKVGVVYDIAGIFTECGLSIDSLVTCRQPYGKYEIVVRGNIPRRSRLRATRSSTRPASAELRYDRYDSTKSLPTIGKDSFCFLYTHIHYRSLDK